MYEHKDSVSKAIALVAQLTAAITITINAEMKLRLFLLATIQQIRCKRLFTE
jgi:hypothetical protein